MMRRVMSMSEVDEGEGEGEGEGAVLRIEAAVGVVASGPGTCRLGEVRWPAWTPNAVSRRGRWTMVAK